MNLLITNSQEIQAYTIMRSLRPFARKVVITVGGDSVNHTGFEGMLPHSRFIDAKHPVPYFAGDWLAGRLDDANTDAEESYVRRIEEICRLEKIDVIFPSLDPEVYVFAKNKERFLKQGVVTVVPDAETIRVPMDKGLTMLAAQRAGFPCPRTYVLESADGVGRILAESGPPWLVKPRFTAHALNMILVKDSSELQAAVAKVSEAYGMPIVQEFIGGLQRQNYYVTVDRSGRILSLLSPRATRMYDWGTYRVSTKTAISASAAPYLEEMCALLAELGLWGGYTIQTKVDPRDGIPKLMEINARLGQHLWWRTGLGVNEPMICLQLARGEQPSGDYRFRDGVMLLDPFHDFFILYPLSIYSCFRTLERLLGRGRAGPPSDPGTEPGFWSTFGLYARDYLNFRPRVLCPEIGNLLSDPMPCLQAFRFSFRRTTAPHLRRIADFFTTRFRRLFGNA